MKNEENTHIFDDVFRTMEEHTPELLVPLINEVFKTNYPEDVKSTRLGDKRHLLMKLMETDSCLGIGNKVYHFECESSPNSGVIAIRLFEYVVPVLKSQEYTKEELFEKKLYVLLPYYILRYEKYLPQMEKEEEKRQRLLEEYEDICCKLTDALGKENPLGYSELHKLITRVLDYILKEKEETKKGVQDIMGGHVLESWKEEMIRIGRTEGCAEGCAEGHAALLTKQVQSKIRKGKSLEQIVDELEGDLVTIKPIYERLVAEGIKK